ncbi:Trm112 family protein [Facilibium subflavum]|uniref:Trm112 family protein n=1 Tax=Facilibium subflavum TaxID=2219058 RepID=UPI000E65A753|nr:Trm112 family protein [Facilibium subflavum]
MDTKLLNIIVCPSCKSPLVYDKDRQVLVCKAEKLAYPIIDGIPVMLVDEAKALSLEEIKQYG